MLPRTASGCRGASCPSIPAEDSHRRIPRKSAAG
jgi:hypothetical protein